MTDYLSELRTAWSRLLAEAPASGAMRTQQLSVSTPRGPLVAAIDSDSNRHLLIPLARTQRQRRSLDGANLRLSETALEDDDTYLRYSDIESVNRTLDGLFSEMCSDVLEAVADTENRTAIAVANDVLADWRALFAPAKGLLDRAQIVGLFGELLTLRRLLKLSPSAATTWLGPLGFPQDFAAGRDAIEVKTTLDAKSRNVRIHGLDQLQPAPNGRLSLHFVGLRSDSLGESLGALVSTVLAMTDDRDGLTTQLAAAGFHLADSERYDDQRFKITEDEWFTVDDDFPRIVAKTIRPEHLQTLHDVDYSVELPASASAMTASGVTSALERFTSEALK